MNRVILSRKRVGTHAVFSGQRYVRVIGSTVRLAFQNRSGVLQASLTGLKWALFAEVTPDLFTTAIAKGLTTTDSAGVCIIDITSSGVSAGVTVGLVVFKGTGSASDLSQLGFIGPVVVA